MAGNSDKKDTDRKWKEPDHRAFFSDTTADYVIPPAPEPYGRVTVRLRVGAGQVQGCFLVLEGEKAYLRMHAAGREGSFDYYETSFFVGREPLRYYFKINSEGRRFRFTRRGVRNTVRPADLWHIVPGFQPPSWAEGAVMYQIFVDRFRNGDPANDVRSGEYLYMGKPVVRVSDWEMPPSTEGFREFYGGDLQGVIDSLDYLQDLGVEAVYLNPVFLSPSSHKYDTQDYSHIDPHFGRMVEGALKPEGAGDGEGSLGTVRSSGRKEDRNKDRKEKGLSFAESCGNQERMLSPENLEAGDRLFAELVRRAHERGIRVILDGVFNHCGSSHRWMDRERIYENLPGTGRAKGAFISKKSPYADYFRFFGEKWPANSSYECWWGCDTLPKLNYEGSRELCRIILELGRKWVSPPFSADGWRLDVAADLGHSREFNHFFWRSFRDAVKEANPEAVILAENYADSKEWLQGGEWDTIMNYEFFMEPVTWFFTGMEKHSERREEEKYGDPDIFWQHAGCFLESGVPDIALRCSMNQLSNHDHSRFLTRTNRKTGTAARLGARAASEGVRGTVMRQAVLLQMTWIGAPTIYYGDEAGLCGFTDPDNRRTYPWGREDRELIRCHRILIALRKASPALRRGSLLRLPDADGVLAYARFAGADRAEHFKGGCLRGESGEIPEGGCPKPAPVQYPDAAVREAWFVLFNINYREILYEADAMRAGIPADTVLERVFVTDRGGFFAAGEASGEEKGQAVPPGALPPVPVRGGSFRLLLPPESGILLRWRR